jgi:MFS family permease
VYGISLFLPSIIQGLGYTSSTAQLLTVPIYITASVLAVVVAWYSDRAGKRSPFLLGCFAFMAIGFIMCVEWDTGCDLRWCVHRGMCSVSGRSRRHYMALEQ